MFYVILCHRQNWHSEKYDLFNNKKKIKLLFKNATFTVRKLDGKSSTQKKWQASPIYCNAPKFYKKNVYLQQE